MTTAEPPTQPSCAAQLVIPAAVPRPRSWLTTLSCGVALLATQALAASAPQPIAVRWILPSEGLLAGLGDGLRRGYGQAMAEAMACGFHPPALQLGWLEPQDDPLVALQQAPRSELLVAPPAAALAAYGRLAEQRRLTVLLPLQRGSSLAALPQLPGSDQLWPIVPARALEADRLAQGLLAQERRRVMVVRDGSAEALALSRRFQAGFSNGRGTLIGPVDGAITVADDDNGAMAQLIRDVDWYRPDALVIITGGDGPLAHRLRRAAWPEGLLLAWVAPLVAPRPQPQLGVDPLSRGPGWAGFATRFAQRWGYRPGLVESAGYDTGLIAMLASLRVQGRPGWDLHWFNARAQPLPFCTALQQRRLGLAVRPQAASSRFDLAPGISPGADLRLQRLAASPP